MSQGCEFLITRGKRKGTPCGAKAGCGNRCRAHQVKRPLVAAPKNLFYDVLPTDLQDYIIKMPLVEEILKYQQVLARYQCLEFVRKNYFNPLISLAHNTWFMLHKPLCVRRFPHFNIFIVNNYW